MTERTHCHTPEEALEHLKRAEEDLEAGLTEQKASQAKIEKAQEKIKIAQHEIENPCRFMIDVLYDGVKKPQEVRTDETVKQVLDVALAAFGNLPNPHTLSLYKDGHELADAQTVKEAGIKPHDILLLRPSKVKGGA